jgi:hypothetical protein
LIFLQFAGVGCEQAERGSGNAARQAVPMPELRRQGSLFPNYKNINRRPGEGNTIPQGVIRNGVHVGE